MEPKGWRCRISLFVCFLGESVVLEIFQFQFFRFFFEGYHFLFSPSFLFIYILLLIIYKYYKEGFCGKMNTLVADSGGNKGQFSLLVEAVL